MGEALEIVLQGPPTRQQSLEASPKLTPGPWVTPDLAATQDGSVSHGAGPKAHVGGETVAWELEPQTKQGPHPLQGKFRNKPAQNSASCPVCLQIRFSLPPMWGSDSGSSQCCGEPFGS